MQRLAELQLYLAVRGAATASRAAWRREDADADAADRAALPAAIAEEAEDSGELGAHLQEAGIGPPMRRRGRDPEWYR